MSATADEIHVGDIGTVLRVTVNDAGVARDVSSATVKRILLKKPDGTTLTKDAAFTTNGGNGQIQYATANGDLDQAGTWQIQAYVELTGWSGHTDAEEFEVYSNLN